VERYNASFDTMPQLAKKYGISKQRICEILKRAKRFGYALKRQKLIPRHHDFHQCEICSRILHMAKKDDLITRRQLAQLLNIEQKICRWHLDGLKGSGFVSKKFASIRSEKLAKAIQYYKDHSLSTSAVGKKFGYKNFYSILSYQRKKGINVERLLKSPVVPDLMQKQCIPMFSSTRGS
jgi:hypothetical protein